MTSKVIVATNVAETSLTIDGVVYVVDSGLTKVRMHHAKKFVSSLLAIPISKASAAQRAGRAGRQQPGKCYRLYTEGHFAQLADTSLPEISRCSLSAAVLSLKALGVNDVLTFDFVSPPSRDALVAALEELLSLGALDPGGELTADGITMSRLPLEPAYAKALIASASEGCVAHMLACVAMLSSDRTVLHTPASQRAAAAEAHRRFVSPHGDTLTHTNVLAAFGERAGAASRSWCEAHFVNRRAVESAARIRSQLHDAAIRLALIDPSSPEITATDAEGRRRVAMGVPHIYDVAALALRRSLTAAFFLHVALRRPSGEYTALICRECVSIHPGSVLFPRRPGSIFRTGWSHQMGEPGDMSL